MRLPRKSRLLVALAALGVALAVAGCGGGGIGGGSSKKVSKGAVAQVGHTAISQAEFNGLLKQAERSYRSQKRAFPRAGTSEYATLQNQAIAFLVQRAEFAQKAKELGIVVTDKQVEDRLNQIKKQYFAGNEKRYQDQLKTQGLTDVQVHADLRAQIVSEGIFNKVTASVKISDAAAQDYYNAHPEQYSQAQSRDVRHILVRDKAFADKLYAQLKGGADFAALAKKDSLDPGSKTQGGKLTVSKGQTVPEFDKVAFSLKKNEIAPPVKTQYGWHIIQALSDIKPRQTTPFTQVKEAIKQQLLQQERSKAMTAWVDKVKKEFAKRTAYAVGYAPPPPPTTTHQAPPQHSNNGGNA